MYHSFVKYSPLNVSHVSNITPASSSKYSVKCIRSVARVSLLTSKCLSEAVFAKISQKNTFDENMIDFHIHLNLSVY